MNRTVAEHLGGMLVAAAVVIAAHAVWDRAISSVQAGVLHDFYVILHGAPL